LDLPDARDPAASQSAVPGEEAQEHREHGDVGEAQPCAGGAVQAALRHADDRRTGGQRQCEDERPADRSRTTQLACQDGALCVADRTEQDGCQEQPVDRGDPRSPPCRGEHERGHEACSRRQPEAQARPLTGAQHGHHGGHRRQDADDDRALAGRAMLQRERCAERKADDDAGHHDRQAPPLDGRRPWRTTGAKHQRAENAGYRSTTERDEPRVEVGDRKLRRRQREGERQHAEAAEQQACRNAWDNGWRYRRKYGSVIRVVHRSG
jgi:hypothetical protein